MLFIILYEIKRSMKINQFYCVDYQYINFFLAKIVLLNVICISYFVHLLNNCEQTLFIHSFTH